MACYQYKQRPLLRISNGGCVYTKTGKFDIEFVSPLEGWRMNRRGTQVFAGLLRKLSPYETRRNLRTRAVRRLADRSTCLLVASDLATGHHGHPVGVARLEVHRSEGIRYGEIHDLVVAETHQGIGIGKALVQRTFAVASDLFQLPYVDAHVKPKPTRVRAKQMLQSLGFKLITPADPAVVGSADQFRFQFPKPADKHPGVTADSAASNAKPT